MSSNVSFRRVKQPIRVRKHKRGKKRDRSVFFDDRGYPDPQNEWDAILPDADSQLIRKRKHPLPPLNSIDPDFNTQFNESKHGEKLRRELNLEHLEPAQREKVKQLVMKYWPVFADEGVVVPVKDYECVIDTGTNRPVACKSVTYGELESPLIERDIAKLLRNKMIKQVFDGEWLSKGLLAPKPHQEDITDIEDFVWRFCVNYIPLNAVTRAIAFPIPRCDDAVNCSFGGSRWKWLMDAPSGFHQMKVAKCSQPKLAFAGTRGSKYTYLVMPFGPINAPAIFIIFIHDMDVSWKQLATDKGLTIDERTNTNIIVDDIFSWAPTFEEAIKYLECQLQACMAQNLSLSLKKSFFFPDRVEFVGHDVCTNGNRPAMSKHALLKAWPKFITVRDVAGFVGFINFYSPYIPNCELRMSKLRGLLKLEYETRVEGHYTPAHEDEREDLLQALLADPCLARYNHKLRCYLRTDWSRFGFGYVLCQPDSEHEESLAAMRREMQGGPCEFMKKDGKRLRPCAFGSRRCRGKEPNLHSHLGEGFTGDWAMNKQGHRLRGQRFTWITDCIALRFLLSYDGNNPALLRLQMRIMLWSCDIVHRNAEHLGDADYLSRLGADLDYDPLVRTYLNFTTRLRELYPPVDGPVRPENMPGFRGPRIASQPSPAAPVNVATISHLANSVQDPHIVPILHSIVLNESGGHAHCLETVPVVFGFLTQQPTTPGITLHGDNIPILASELTTFSWVVYGFNSGHFITSLLGGSSPADIVIAVDTRPSGRALFTELASCPCVLDSAMRLLQKLQTSRVNTTIHGYLIHSHRFLHDDTQRRFWKLQGSIVRALQSKRGLQVFVAHVQADCDELHVEAFVRSTSRYGWTVTRQRLYYPDFGDSIADSSTFLFGVHRSTSESRAAVQLPTPPAAEPKKLADFVYPPFNQLPMCVSPARTETGFADQQLHASDPIVAETHLRTSRARRIYNLHRPGDNASITAGAGVYSLDGLCPPFSSPNANIFGSTFGIEVSVGDSQMVRPISSYEVASTYRLDRNLTYKIAHPDNFLLIDCGVPGRVSAFVFEAINLRLNEIRTANFEVLDPSAQHAPAALSQVNCFLNGAVGVRLPNPDAWAKATDSDDDCKLMKLMLTSPGEHKEENIRKVHFCYRDSLRRGLIVLENDQLFVKEVFPHDSQFVKLRIVPATLRNLIFTAFHANPIGGHLNAYRTYFRIRMRYFWPHLFKYCTKLVKSCPGCALSNLTNSRSSELVYGFPVDAPMRVLHVDIYAVGTEFNFDGNRYYLVAACGMTAFSVAEPTAEQNAEVFASALMKIWLRHGFSHTIVVDKDSKFRATFAQTAELLGINIHILSGENHDGMLVERVNRFLNSSLTIFCAERGSTLVAQEGILMALYAWNSAPIAGTDISRSLVVVGREFNFPIDFSADKHLYLTSSPARAKTFAGRQAVMLKASRLVAKELVMQHRAMHRELINSRRPAPREYMPGDMVFARRSVKSDKARGVVGKIKNPYTGPWEVVKRGPGGSYELKHAVDGRPGKRHAMHLSPFPNELVPFEPVDGPDNRYGQLHMPIGKHPYKDASIKGFHPFQPHREPLGSTTLMAADVDHEPIHFPSLAELNAEITDWSQQDIDKVLKSDDLCEEFEVFTGMLPMEPPAPPPTPSDPPPVPDLGQLSSSIVTSKDKLFFIAHKLPGSGVSEWNLVSVALEETLSLHPPAFQDGKFLVNFYICHPADTNYNAINQRYWLEYHPTLREANTNHRATAHLIRPTPSSATYATAEGLRPFRQWVRLVNNDTYISGPFDFAIINGRKTRDRISLADWKILEQRKHLFSNALPSLELPNYSVHLSRFHDTHYSSTLATRYLDHDVDPNNSDTLRL